MKGPAKMASLLISSLFKKPATVSYPAEPMRMPRGFRGKIEFTSDRCIGCKMCMRDCPSAAIEIIKVGDKRFEARFNLSRCIYCAQCVDSCNKDALAYTDNYELAAIRPEQLIVVFHADPQVKPETVS